MRYNFFLLLFGAWKKNEATEMCIPQLFTSKSIAIHFISTMSIQTMNGKKDREKNQRNTKSKHTRTFPRNVNKSENCKMELISDCVRRCCCNVYLPEAIIESFFVVERIQKLMLLGKASDAQSSVIFWPIAAPTNWFWIIIMGGTRK